jgi:hypothetical protein
MPNSPGPEEGFPMKNLTRICGLAVLALAALLASGQEATGGQPGGPTTDTVTLAPFETRTFYVAFAAGEPAVVSLGGPAATNVEMTVYDGDGNVTRTDVVRGRKVAVINVYRAGLFRVELRNIGPMKSTVRVRTN